MAKKGSKENPLTVVDMDKLAAAVKGKLRNYDILKASIKDDFCHYTYEITGGNGIGDKHSVEGKGIIKDELREAFVKLNLHLAIIDEVFKHSGIEITKFNEMHTHELTYTYHVTGIVIKGTASNEQVVLIGTKYVAIVTGRISFSTPPVSMDKLSNYAWWNELKEAVDEVRYQVAEYKEGNYIPVQDDEEPAKPAQGNIFDGGEDQSGLDDTDFDNAKLN